MFQSGEPISTWRLLQSAASILAGLQMRIVPRKQATTLLPVQRKMCSWLQKKTAILFTVVRIPWRILMIIHNAPSMVTGSMHICTIGAIQKPFWILRMVLPELESVCGCISLKRL